MRKPRLRKLMELDQDHKAIKLARVFVFITDEAQGPRSVPGT